MICNSSKVLFRQTKFSFENVYNIEEIGFLMGFAQSEKVITIVRIPRHQGRLRAQDGIREIITALEGICPDGISLKPQNDNCS